MQSKFDVLFCDWSGCISNDLQTVYAAHLMTVDSFGIKKIIPLEAWQRLFVTDLKTFYEQFRVFAPMDEIDERYPQCYETAINLGIKPTVYPDAPAALEKISREVPIIVVSAQMQHALEREAEDYSVKKICLFVIRFPHQ